ncbi:MAG: phage portal protein [Clostridiales bacterium]|nr:phage portal protein [Clostridiales bacterium]
MPLFKRLQRKTGQARDEPTGVQTSVYQTRADRYMTASEAIYAAVSRVANTFSCLPLHLYKGRELQKDHPLEKLVSFSPNPWMTSYWFRLTMQALVGNEGNAYALVVPTMAGGVDRLDILEAGCVTPVRVTDQDGAPEMWYRVTPRDTANQFWVHNSSMLVIRNISANGEKGIKPIDVLRDTIKYASDIKTYTMEQIKAVNSSIVLTVPNTGLNADRRNEIIKQFLQAYNDSGRSAIVLDGGMTVNALNRTPVDNDVIGVENMTRNRVATVYNIPPRMLGDTSDKGFTDNEQQMRELAQMTVLPIVCQWESELDRKLLTWEQVSDGYHFGFNMDSLLRGDVKTMADKHTKAIRGGWMTPNEARDDDNLPPDPDGEKLLAARDLLPLEMILKGMTVKDSGR